MPWLNWSLKLYISLRTISLLIPTHNTQVYVQWMPYSCVWLYLIKCVFTYSIFVDSNTKRFLSVLVVFGKYFVLQKLKISKKTVLSYFGDSIASKSSHMPQSQDHESVLATCSRVDLKISVYPSRETSSHEKHLENFSKLLVWSVLVGVSSNYLVTYLSLEKRVFCTVRAVFKIFFSFPSNFMWLFTFSLNCSYPNTSCHSLRTPLLLHFFSKSSRKGMGLLFLTSFSCFEYYFLAFLSCYCILSHIVFERFTLRVLGMVSCVWCWFHLVSYYWSHCANICSVLWHLLVFILIWEMGLVLFCVLFRLWVWEFKYVCGFGLPILYYYVFMLT